MAMIFPGMDPYLEDPDLWPGVHSRLVVYISDQLQPMIGPRYIAAVEERVYLEGPGREVPVINIPLAGDDPDVPLRIQDALERLYEAGSYRRRVNYSQSCYPPLRDSDQAWAMERIAAAGPA
jgi:hypothetical protein